MIAKNKKIKRDDKGHNIFFPALLVVLLFCAIGFLIASNYRIITKRTEMIDKIETMKKEITDLEEQNKNLQIGISQATSTARQEEKMREQGYQKPGEQNIVVVPPEKKPEAPVQEQKSWWERFLAKISF
jgi:cell division protein FtsB